MSAKAVARLAHVWQSHNKSAEQTLLAHYDIPHWSFADPLPPDEL